MTINTIILFFIMTTLVLFKGQNQKLSEHQTQQTFGDKVSEIGKNICFIFQDNQNNFWFASDGDGIYKYDGRTIFQITEKHGLCGNFVRLIQQEKNGNILISTSKGICIFNGKQFNILPSYKPKFESTDLSNIILLFGNYFQNNLLNQFQIPQTSKITKSYSQTPYAVYCSYKDSKGNLWFGTESRGVCKYDGRTFMWLDNDELGLAVRSIFEDNKGNIWIGNNGYGLFRYDGKTLTNITKEYKLENPDFQTTLKGKKGTLARVWSITEDRTGVLWIGTIDSGLWKYDGKTLTNLTTEDGLASNSISTLFCDKSGKLWIGSDKGLTIYDMGTFKTLSD